MKDGQTKFIGRDGQIHTLKDLFDGKREARKAMAALPFETKIHMLISLQETARSWGGLKDLVVWKV